MQFPAHILAVKWHKQAKKLWRKSGGPGRRGRGGARVVNGSTLFRLVCKTLRKWVSTKSGLLIHLCTSCDFCLLKLIFYMYTRRWRIGQILNVPVHSVIMCRKSFSIMHPLLPSSPEYGWKNAFNCSSNVNSFHQIATKIAKIPTCSSKPASI